jgi:Leucine-rich repeat (LRR) protein
MDTMTYEKDPTTAEEEIRHALQTRATQIDLRGFKLKTVPVSLRSLDWSVEVNLSNNNLSDLPAWLAELDISSLDVSINKLCKIPEWVRKCENLQDLTWNTNKLEVVPDWIGELGNLTSLSLASNELRSLPESLSHLTNLQSLNLFNNHITYFGRLDGLGFLRVLQISKNEIVDLPIEIQNLRALNDLTVSGNRLNSIPEWISECRRLKRLNLSDNSITDLPKSMAQLSLLRELHLYKNGFERVPIVLPELVGLTWLSLHGNSLSIVPDDLGALINLKTLILGASGEGGNPLGDFPTCVRHMHKLEKLWAARCDISDIPEWLGECTSLKNLYISHNNIIDLPGSLSNLSKLTALSLDNNPLNSEIAAAYEDSLAAVMRYLAAKADGQMVLNEAKLIIVGEGEVGKSSLLAALRGDPWEDDRVTTHGIEIKPVEVVDVDSGTRITLNGWDFGGQRIYRPTHQLFFSAPAVYLVVWKPREGPQQGSVKEWIKLIKHREPDAKILVVATHGGPGHRQPDLDRQEIWDLFGREMVLDFF